MVGRLEGKELLRFARSLQRVTSYEELIELAVRELEVRTPYQTGWIYMAGDDGDANLGAAGGKERERVWSRLRRIVVAGDALVAEIMTSTEPVVVVDARTDSRPDPKIVRCLDNRTIIDVPLV